MMLTLALTSFLLLQSPSEVPAASIEGKVLLAGSNKPIEGAHVTLHRITMSPDESEVSEQSLKTGSDGQFVITGVDPGSYLAIASREGYADQVYGARIAGEHAMLAALRGGVPTEDSIGQVAVLKLQPGQTLRDIHFYLTPTGVVTGRILGFDRRPLVRVGVQLVPDMFNSGGAHILGAADVGAETDDRGEFRVMDVPPGRYYVVARLQGHDAAVERYRPRTYYPGTGDVAHALTIEVLSGQETRLPDFSVLPRTESHRISGRIVDERAQPDRERDIVLGFVSRTPGDMLEVSDIREAELSPDGTFLSELLPLGSYWLFAYLDEQGIVGMQDVDVSGSDVEGISLRIVDPIAVRGSVTLDGQPISKSSVTGEIRIGLELPEIPFAEVSVLASRSARLDIDGMFSIEGIFPGKFRPFAMNFPPDMYVKRMRFAAIDVLDRLISFERSTQDLLEVDIGTRGGQMRGTVLDAEGKPTAGVQVVLVPRSAEAGSEFIKTTYSDAAGHYALRGIAPGDYTLLAWQKAEESYLNREYVRRFEAEGKSVNIAEGSSQATDVQVISAR